MPFTYRVFAITLSIVVSISSEGFAQETFTWTGTAGDTDWNNGSNWGGSVVAGAFPDLDDTAVFDTDATASGGSVTNFINSANFLLDGPGDVNQITIGDGGVINNSGTISFAQDGFFSDDDGDVFLVFPGSGRTSTNPDDLPLGTVQQFFQIDGNVALEGTGTIDLQGTLTGFRGTGDSVLENNSTIRLRPIQELFSGVVVGGGTITGVEFRNRNRVEVDDSVLLLQNTTFDNTGGVIAVNQNSDTVPSAIDVTSQSVLSGGVLQSFGNGTPAANDPTRTIFPSLEVQGVLRDVQLEGNWSLNGLSLSESFTDNTLRGVIEGEITNNGTIEASFIDTNGDVTFTGTGDLEVGTGDSSLVNVNAIAGRNNSQVLNDVDHTITGNFGVLRRMEIENRGTIIAEVNSLELDDVSLNSTGTLLARDSGVLEQNGGDVTATSIDIETGGAYDLNSGRLEVEQFNGSFFQDGGTFSPGIGVGTANITGDYTLRNNATLEIELAEPGLFDQLNVGGDLNLLGGGLSVVAADGFSISSGDVFDIFSVDGNQSGSFLGLDEGSAIGGLGNTFSITYAAGDGNDVALVSTLTPGSVNFSVAGTSDVAYVVTQRVPDSTTNNLIEVAGLDILPGSEFTLGPLETLNLDDGNGTLFVSEGSVFTGNGIVEGNIFNEGLVRIPIVPLSQVFGGFVEVATPQVITVAEPVIVNASTVARFTTPSTTIQGAPVQIDGTLAFDADLEVTGSFTQTETGALRLFIGGDEPGVSYSQLIVGQEVLLDGELQIVLQPELFETFDYTFDLGDTFDFIVAEGGITLGEDLSIRNFVTEAGQAAFSDFTLTEYDSGISSDPDQLLEFMFEFGGSDMGLMSRLFSLQLVEGDTILRATAVANANAIPEPSSMILLSLGIIAAASSRRRSLAC